LRWCFVLPSMVGFEAAIRKCCGAAFSAAGEGGAERPQCGIQRGISECRGRNSPSDSEKREFRAPQTEANIARSAIRSDKATVRWTVAPFVQPSASEGEQAATKLSTTVGLSNGMSFLFHSLLSKKVKNILLTVSPKPPIIAL